jgi:hypothetical protein
MLDRVEDEVDPLTDSQLSVDRCQVVAQRMLADMQRCRDNLVGCASLTDHSSYYFPLGSCQASVSGLVRFIALSPGKGLQNSPHRAAIQPRLAGVHAFDGLQNGFGPLRLVNDTSRAGKNSAFLDSRVTKAGKDEYHRLACQVRQEIKPAFTAKVQVEQGHMRPIFFHGRHRLTVASGYACQLELWTAAFY